MTSNINRVDELVSWAKMHGSSLNEDVEVYSSPEYGVSLRVKELATGEGLDENSKTAKLPAKSCVVSCPFNISLSYLNALDDFHGLWSHSKRFPQEFLSSMEPDVIGCFFLMQQHIHSSKSYWAPYIKSLPQPHEHMKLATPIYYSEEDMKWLKHTNLERAVEERRTRWKREFEAGREILERSPEMESLKGRWTWDLYRWARTIFSSRSFVSALIPDEVYGDLLDKPVGSFKSWRDKIQTEGPYPILFPLLDIANHSSKARVTWFTEAKKQIKSVNLIMDDAMPAGAQVFNNYAPKSNSELLMGYGFLMQDCDDYAIELMWMEDEKKAIREAQRCNRESQDASGRLIYQIRAALFQLEGAEPFEFPFLEHGLMDTLAVMVANKREAQYMKENPQYCPEKNMKQSLGGFMGRNTLAAVSLLARRLRFYICRLDEAKEDLGEPSTPFQCTAQVYREGQYLTLLGAHLILRNFLENVKIPRDPGSYTDDNWPRGLILDAYSGFTYLQVNHYPLWRSAARAMEDVLGLDLGKSAEDQDDYESNVLLTTNVNFGALLPQYDYALLCLWTFIILSIHYSTENDLSDGLDMWMEEMLKTRALLSSQYVHYWDDDYMQSKVWELMETMGLYASEDYVLPMIRENINEIVARGIKGQGHVEPKDVPVTQTFGRIANLAARIAASEMFGVSLEVQTRPGDPRVRWSATQEDGRQYCVQNALFIRRKILGVRSGV